MPTYEYRCPAGHHFEVFQRMTDPAGATCPECGEAASRQISGGAGFLFKGEGFYITDYRSEDYRKKASAEAAPGDAGTKAKPDTRPETKPASGSTDKGSGGASTPSEGR